MGPGRFQNPVQFPQRPRFLWDLRSVPWTDGIGDQAEYAKAVKMWSSFHDNLPDGNSNKIGAANRRIVLMSNLFGRAKDLCDGLDISKIATTDGVDLIISIVYKKVPLTVVTNVFEELQKLMTLKRGTSEPFPDYELRFAARLSRFNAFGKSVALSGAMLALMLLANVGVDPAQRISILAAAAPSNSDLSARSSIDDYIQVVQYETVASVLRQCEKDTARYDPVALAAAYAQHMHRESNQDNPAGSLPGGRTDGAGRRAAGRVRMTREQVQRAKNKSQCKRCGAYGHWYNEHFENGSLKRGAISSDHPITTAGDSNDSALGKNVNGRNGGAKETADYDHGSASQTAEESAKPRRQLHFSMATPTSCKPTSPIRSDDAVHVITSYDASTACDRNDINYILGPLLDCSAPYSAIGIVELRKIASLVLSTWDGSLLPLPESVADRPFWQYGRDTHASDLRAIPGAVVLSARTDDGTVVQITHVVLEGSSQWVIGQNVTRYSDICKIGEKRLVLPGSSNHRHRIPVAYEKMHHYLTMDTFYNKDSTGANMIAMKSVTRDDTPTSEMHTALSPHEIGEEQTRDGFVEASAAEMQTMTPANELAMSWHSLKRVIDRVHRHVRGHVDFGDMKYLLQRNCLWTNDAEKYLRAVVEQCKACSAAIKPQPSRKVSLASLSRDFNDAVCVDHLFLDDINVFHMMDSSTRYSIVVAVDALTTTESITQFELHWLATFWPPVSIYADKAFDNNEFVTFLDSIGSHLCAVPPRRHSKNVIESKHGIIRSIFIRLQEHSPEMDKRLLAGCAVSVSNDLCGSDILSSFEMARGFCRPVTACTVRNTAQVTDELADAQQTLAAKRKLTRILRTKSIHEPTLAIGDLVEVYLKHANSKRGQWSSPRVVLEVDHSTWTVTVPGSAGRTMQAAFEDIRPAINPDTFASLIRDACDKLDDEITALTAPHNDILDKDPKDSPTTVYDNPASRDIGEPVYGSDDPPFVPDVGSRVEIYWDGDMAYYADEITEVSNDGRVHISYDDGDSDTLNMANETWRYASSAVLKALAARTTVESEEPRVLDDLLQHFGNRPFMRHEAQAFPSYVIFKAYQREELTFLKTVRRVPLIAVPVDANIISSHVLYKVKREETGSLLLKGRIAPHGNEDAMRSDLRKDCSMCAPHGVRILLSIAALCRWRLMKIDVKSAFLQTGAAARDVYVIPPHESEDRGVCLWLLLTAAYGLVNANAKFQVQSDQWLMELGFRQVKMIPQLFYLMRNDQVVVVLCKSVEDILAAGIESEVIDAAEKFHQRFELGTVSLGPGVMRFFGLNLVQHDDLSISNDGDDKLNCIETHPLSRFRRRQGLEKLNAIEIRPFKSVNSSIGWLGVHASPFCAYANSSLQQMSPNACVKEPVHQTNTLRELKKHGTLSHYPHAPKGDHTISILVYSDAGHHCDTAQHLFIAGVLIGHFDKGSVFHTLAWQSHKSARPVRSIRAAEILACGEAITEANILAKAISFLLNVDVPLIIALDSKDLFDSLSTQRGSIDKSIRADVSVIRYEFEMDDVRLFLWVPGKENLTDPGNKSDSPLYEALRLLLATGKVPLSTSSTLSRSIETSLE